MLLTRSEEILFLPPRNSTGEIFTGRKTAADDEDALEKSGFENVLPRSAIESTYLKMLEASHYLYTLPGDSGAKASHAGRFARGTQRGRGNRAVAGGEIASGNRFNFGSVRRDRGGSPGGVASDEARRIRI